ncbi:MAG: DUF2304 domain-containing protein [Chitinophagales bacterium]|nr:DUF2304 domain-containing protein [Chitinophagales bacterium]
MARIQIIAIFTSILFLLQVAYLIHRGRLREEYAFIWIICTGIILFFSFWRDGLETMARLMGVYAPPNLVFMGAIFALLVYLLHLSVTVSKLQQQNKTLAQEHALLQQRMEQKLK